MIPSKSEIKRPGSLIATRGRQTRHLLLSELVLSSSGRSVMEDRGGVVGNVAFVVDGATQVEDGAFVPSLSEGTWIAELIESELLNRCFPIYYGSLIELLQYLATRVRDELLRLDYPLDRTPPLASLGIARISDSSIDLALLGDVSIVTKREGGSVERFVDSRFLNNELVAIARRGSTLEDDQTVLQGIVQRRKKYIEGRDGPVVLSSNPQAVSGCITVSCDATSGMRIILASDGFMRLCDVYHELTVAELASAVDSNGLNTLMNRLRQREERAKLTHENSRLVKASDDAVALSVTVT